MLMELFINVVLVFIAASALVLAVGAIAAAVLWVINRTRRFYNRVGC
jgi:hypothetical protein